MDYLGLVFEIVFLMSGVYIYLFAIGKLQTKDPKMHKRAEAFREKNAWWMRILALGVIAVMLINVMLSVKEFF